MIPQKHILVYFILCSLLLDCSCRGNKRSTWNRDVDVTEELEERISCLDRECSQRYKGLTAKQVEEVEIMKKEYPRFLDKISGNGEAINSKIKELKNKLASSKDVSSTFNNLHKRFPAIVDDVRTYFIEIEGIKRNYASIPPEIADLHTESEGLKAKYSALDEKKIKQLYDNLVAKIKNTLSTLHESVDSISNNFRDELLSLEADLTNYNAIVTAGMSTQKQLLETNIKKLAVLELQQIKVTTNQNLLAALSTVMTQVELTIKNNNKLKNETHINAQQEKDNITSCETFHKSLMLAYQLAQTAKAHAALILFNTTTQDIFSNILTTIGGNFAIQLYSLTTNPPADPILATLSPGAFRDIFMESIVLNPIADGLSLTVYGNLGAAIEDGGAKKIWLGLKNHVDRYGNTVDFPDYTAAGGAACQNFLKTNYKKDRLNTYYIELA